MRSFLAVSALVFTIAHAAEADACTPVPCIPGSLLPSSGTIPGNAKALRWHVPRPIDPKKVAAMVTLQRDGEDVPFSVEAEGDGIFRIVPKQPWVVGATYTFEAQSTCKQMGPEVHSSTFDVGPEAPLPETLGVVKLDAPGRGLLKIGTSAGSCSVEEAAAWADVVVELSDAAKPWAALIDYAPKVDGEAWHYASTIRLPPPRGQSEIGRGKARVYARCEADGLGFEGAAQGAHQVAMVGHIYGESAELSATPLSVSLDCADTAEPIGAEPAHHPTEEPKAASSPEASHDTAGAHAWGCAVGGSTPWALLLLLGLRRRRAYSGMHCVITVRNTKSVPTP